MIPSKQPHAFYMGNIQRYFRFMKTRVIFYTSQDMFKRLSPYAGKNITFRIVEFKHLEVFKEFPKEFWERQIQRDPESYHTWQLGAIWANKKYFVSAAAKEFPDEWIMWMDAGCVRKETWAPFVDEFTRRRLPITPSVYAQVLNPFPKDVTFFKYPNVYVAGALILFHRSCIQDYINNYNTILKEYDANSVSATMDQYIMASVMNRYPRWIGVERMKLDIIDYLNTCPDPWFFFLAYF